MFLSTNSITCAISMSFHSAYITQKFSPKSRLVWICWDKTDGKKNLLLPSAGRLRKKFYWRWYPGSLNWQPQWRQSRMRRRLTHVLWKLTNWMHVVSALDKSKCIYLCWNLWCVYTYLEQPWKSSRDFANQELANYDLWTKPSHSHLFKCCPWPLNAIMTELTVCKKKDDMVPKADIFTTWPFIEKKFADLWPRPLSQLCSLKLEQSTVVLWGFMGNEGKKTAPAITTTTTSTWI